MAKPGRNLYVLFNTGLLDEEGIEQETRCITHILLLIDRGEAFCKAHELVDRNSISTNPKKIIKESRHFRLRAFRFLINKN